jgi:baseplate J-like protein
MSDDQTIYISPDDDLTTVRERLEQIPSRKITLVIPNQTQLRSHVAWKLLYARTRELNKEVLIVSSDPQVRSVAHAVKFRVAHSLESTSNSGRSKSGSRVGTGRSNAGTSRSSPAVSPSATTPKEPASKRGGSRPSRSTRAPSSGRTSTRSQQSPLTPAKPLESLQSHIDEPRTPEPHEPRPQRLNLPERKERREEQSSHRNQIYDFRAEVSPAIHPLPSNQIEEPDLLIEDYNQALHIREAASGSYPVVPKPDDAGPAITSSGDVNTHIPEAGASPVPTNQSPRPVSQVYGEDDPFIYMQDDSQPPSQAEQKGEAILQDDEISQEYPLLQKPAISDLPPNAIKSESAHASDEDDFVPPSSSTPIRQARPQDMPFEEGHEKAEERPSRLSPRPYGVPPWGNRSDTLPPSRQTFNEEEDQLQALPEPTMPMQVPQAIALPMPRAQSKPLAPISKPLSPRTGERVPQQAPTQRPSTGSTTRNGSRVPQSVGSRPVSQQAQQYRGPAGPRSAIGTRRPATRGSSGRSRRLFLILASVIAILVILFGVLYLNITSTVQITVKTQDYTHNITFTLSDQKQSGTVPAKSVAHEFTQTVAEPATGTTMQSINQATGAVYFTNTGTASVQIPSQTVLTTKNNVKFVTTANALILPPNTNPTPVPVLVPIQAHDPGASGNVFAGSITVIPPESLANIAQAQSPPVTAESLKTTLTVSNPDPTTGGDAHQVAAVTQQDLDKAKNDLNKLVQADIDTWQQTMTKNGLVGQPVRTDTPINAPATDTAEPNKTFSATIKVTATVLVAPLDAVQSVALSQLKNAVQSDKQWGPTFAIIGEDPQGVKIDLAHQSPSNGNTVTVPATGNAGPNLNTTDLQNSIKGKSPSEAQAILHKRSQDIQMVDIQTQPGIFNWEVSPWADHIHVIFLPAAKK